MRRRILLAIVFVTLLATVVLTVPLAIVIANRENNDSYRELDRVAERTAAGLPRTLDRGSDPVELPTVEAVIRVAVYDLSGQRIAGRGPAQLDGLGGTKRVTTLYTQDDSERIVVRPVTIDEQRVGVVRVSEPIADTTARIRRDLLLLLAIDLGALLIAATVGWVVAARLVRPLHRIRDDAVRLGNGDFSICPVPSGVSDLDDTADALAETATRLESAMRNEREFSANASHQLRTPITAMRLQIETEMDSPRSDRNEVLHESITELDRLESTIETLLAVARDQPLHRTPFRASDLADVIRSRWNGPLAAQGRELRVSAPADSVATVSEQVVGQIIDVLVDNAQQHGHGEVRVALTVEGATFRASVTDEGDVGPDQFDLFTRRNPEARGHGVGLSLARALAEAEGGRLTLAKPSPTTFQLVLPGQA